MPPLAIVEHLDIVEHITVRLVTRSIDFSTNTLFLQAAEEGLGNGVVPAVATPAHAHLQAVLATEALPVIAVVLDALV